MVKIAAVAMIAVMVLAGCGSFWQDQGTASRTQAEARLRQAEAARQNAQAAIIDAESRGALAESQAHALRTTIDANADLTRQAVSMADNSEYVWVFASIALAVLVFAGLVVGLVMRRPTASRQVATIETMDGTTLRMIQEPAETHAAFLLRVNAAAFAAAEREQRLIDAPKTRALTRT